MKLEKVYRIHVCKITNYITVEKWSWSDEYSRWRWNGSMTRTEWHENACGIKFFSCYEEAMLQCVINGLNVIDNDDWEYLYENRVNFI